MNRAPTRPRINQASKADACTKEAATFPELSDARLVSVTCSDGVGDVWMGRPERLN